ncbi:MAG: SDR family oxidoreductase [Gammaproteobacteria bacterium]|nr:SDR family oxidoreductase [Gammaproteobacteria bacterium]MCP4090714.1 SDR family oxidoreductase [Gammaproteobacteria bacterium]MCP4277141.1 SDR family oxidoreductase [Gammaproteobacteria bacterium]MCP4832697.1 SDR family oxidoreductase [Gammaproteobacteria bacterium]MCP4928049.1 SDR family oxidoreductase [Gammaproteobacteria bacterium]
MLNQILAILIITLSCISCTSTTVNLNPNSPTVLITGANRGLGLEFSRQYAASGWNVIASCRNPRSATNLHNLTKKYPQVAIEKLDVTSDRQVNTLAQKYHSQPIDILLNNAGIYGTLEKQTLGSFDFEELKKVFDINTIGSLRVSQAFLDNVLLSDQKKIISLGGGMGTQSIGRLFGGHYFMKMSKAAHLMAMGVMQTDLKNTELQIVMISPGRVDTQLMRDSGWSGPSISAEQSAQLVIEQIAALKPDMNGRLILYNGTVIPW